MKPGKASYTSFSSKKDRLDAVLLEKARHSCPSAGVHPVFVVDETFFRSRTPDATHWSVAWADLMMTMFILFLTLFVYQLTHREFLSQQEPEIVAGASMPVPESQSTAPLPFRPINTVISNQEDTLLKRLEPDSVKQHQSSAAAEITPQPAAAPPLPLTEDPFEINEEPLAQIPEPQSSAIIPAMEDVQTVESSPEARTSEQPHKPASQTEKNEIITQIYDLSKVTLTKEKLSKFASVELIPDKTMRIILTGDLLFSSGQAQLTRQAKESLYKLLPAIKQTPYMINVIGHTDSIPMHSEKFASNWQLSTARASEVARFLIEEGKIPATQLVVSGYSFYRPLKPNTNAANRMVNRRVEIVLSKEPPSAQTATLHTVQ